MYIILSVSKKFYNTLCDSCQVTAARIGYKLVTTYAVIPLYGGFGRLSVAYRIQDFAGLAAQMSVMALDHLDTGADTLSD